MTQQHTKDIALFCGGRGSANLIKAMSNDQKKHLTVLVNAYDDGRSTGRIRRFIPGMLGPSDLRKNMSYMMPSNTMAEQVALSVFEHRLSDDTEQSHYEWQQLLSCKGALAEQVGLLQQSLRAYLMELAYVFENYRLNSLKHQRDDFDFKGSTLGNIFIAGAYLKNNRDFNTAIADVSGALNITGRILNITNGENLYVVGQRRSGDICFDESEMVRTPLHDPIVEVHLLREKPSPQLIGYFHQLPQHKQQKMLDSYSILPIANPQAIAAIKSADEIVFSAGCQSSSLWPSYLSKGIADAIEENETAKKVMIMNIKPDNDIMEMSGYDLIKNMLNHLQASHYNAFSSDINKLITHVLISQSVDHILDLDSTEENRLKPVTVQHYALEDLQHPGTHDGRQLLSVLDQIAA